ncbi:winged helix-turn-helix transcriptional regulator [Nocardia sp. NPDC088792]|uniref:winged helix-turn-helix transcriptional regulator n=1 Tax=Nocardia sp. NPDC088792 TaxID=3364332 RepID=UPI0037FA5A12
MQVGVQADVVAADAAGDAFNGGCRGRVVFDHITSRWGVLVLAALRSGPVRFSGLHVKISGMSEKMLSQTLRTLVRDGLIARTVDASTPPKVSYSLTPLGSSASEPLQSLLDWISVHSADVERAQRHHDEALAVDG